MITKNDVVFLHENIQRLYDIRNSKIAYAVLKNSKKIAKEREVIVETLNKSRGEVPVDEWLKSTDGAEFLNSESGIDLHLIDAVPEDVELTATELLVLDFMTVETEDEGDGKPIGPPVKK